MAFVGRSRETELLRAEFAKDAPSLAIVYGRRRVGKSALLQRAAQGHGPHVYFQATKVEDALNVRAFKRAVADALGPDPVFEGLGDWEAMLTWLARKAVDVPRLVVILDEFPYLTGGGQALPSVIQRFVDSGAMRAGRLKLVLCGSVVSHMEELLTERNPLYGRRTLTMRLREMSLREATLLFPGRASTWLVETYATFGGVPYYLQAVDPEATHRDNVVRLLLSSSGLLYSEPELLMQTELRETVRYSSIVGAIASGATKLGEVVNRAGLRDGAQVGPYLDTLARMGIVAGRRSFGSSPKERDVRYEVTDPLFRYWYRFVLPSVSAIESGFGTEVHDRRVAPQWSAYMGDQFERVCRDHVRLHAQERIGVPMSEVGKAWAADHDLDVIGEALDGSHVYGECKWESKPMGASVLRNLRAQVGKRRDGDGAVHLALFAKAGFEPPVEREAAVDAGLLLYGLDELVRSPLDEPEAVPSP